MIILSLFDGMSCGRIALDRAGIKIDKYYASEIDKYAQIVSAANYPDIIRLGDITKWKEWNIYNPDMIIGGSPCQGFSFAGKGLNFEDERSKLFFTFVDILKYYKPKYFLLENVCMKKEHNDVISEMLGDVYPECVTQTELFRTGRLEPIMINSALVSAQNRERLYWTNIPNITHPKDKGILLKDIIDNAMTEKDKAFCIDASYAKGASVEQYKTKSRRQLVRASKKSEIRRIKNRKGLEGKANCLQASMYKGEAANGVTLICARMVGRKIDENGKRQDYSGIHAKQRIEPRKDNKSGCLTGVQKDNLILIGHAENIKGHDYNKRVYSQEGKSPSICSASGGHLEPKIVEKGTTCFDCCNCGACYTWRKLTPIECERLQTVPDNFTAHVSNSQRYKMLGNGWTVDVIAHIFSFIPSQSQICRPS